MFTIVDESEDRLKERLQPSDISAGATAMDRAHSTGDPNAA
ncbi:MAG TPA: hypothetical protein VGJ78_07910 [Vicinamibacterales bacterium]|jgi:hypothetical protein